MNGFFRHIVCLLLLVSVKMTFAQTTFSVSDTIQDIYKNTSFGTIHGYVQLTNLTPSDLQLRWKLSITGKHPASWQFSCADPDTNYFQILSGDSADFTLDLTSTTTNKLVYGLDHNQEPGSAQMHFFIFDPANPSESVTVHFNLYILDATGINNTIQDHDFFLKNNILVLKKPKNILSIEVITLNGKVSYYQSNNLDNNTIELPDKNQIYFIRIIKASQEEINIKYFNR